MNAFCDGIDVLAEYYKLSKTQTCKKILTDFFGMDLYAPLTDADLESERRYKSTVRATETLDSDEVENGCVNLKCYITIQVKSSQGVLWACISEIVVLNEF